MNSKLIRTSEWPGQSLTQDPIKQLFDRVFEGGLFPNTSADDSSVVTSQWAPRVDIKEEAHRFVLYADVPGVELDAIEVQMDKGMLTIKGERKADNAQTLSNSRASSVTMGHFTDASPCLIAPTRRASPPRGVMACCRSSSPSAQKRHRAVSG